MKKKVISILLTAVLATGMAACGSNSNTAGNSANNTADNAQNISASTEEQTSAMHEISRSSEALAGLAKQLEGEVGKFKIK